MDLWTVQEVVNGGKIKHLQFTEFLEGHGSIYGTFEDGTTFKLHITELLKMMDEFQFEVRNMSGDVLDHWLKVDWESTNKLREEKSFTHKSELEEYKRNGAIPNKVNYVVKSGEDENTTFTEFRTGPYYSGNMVITKPEDVREDPNLL